MSKFLKSLFVDPTADWTRCVSDPVLGELVLNEDAGWDTTIELNGEAIGFCIGGEAKPDEALVEHARSIVRNFVEFERMIRDFLSAECVKQPEWAEEIRQLRIASVDLFWPGRPNDGEICFSGPDPYRLWRCGYIDRRPNNLGFDD